MMVIGYIPLDSIITKKIYYGAAKLSNELAIKTYRVFISAYEDLPQVLDSLEKILEETEKNVR